MAEGWRDLQRGIHFKLQSFFLHMPSKRLLAVGSSGGLPCMWSDNNAHSDAEVPVELELPELSCMAESSTAVKLRFVETYGFWGVLINLAKHL